jgi:spermidine/putrescine transport system substrate-binding protein
MAEAEELLNFMLEPQTAIAVAEGQKYPPSLDPTKVKMTDAVNALPAFDPTGTLKGLVFRDTKWNDFEKEQKKAWNRIEKGA